MQDVMPNFSTTQSQRSGVFFDQLAADYDVQFTASLIGQAQRSRVWKIIPQTFRAKENILEINCGTGEDAMFMSKMGVSVFACDASRQMIEQAKLRPVSGSSRSSPTFHHLPTEELSTLSPHQAFDGVFSNFSGLNCIEDLATVAESLSALVKPGGKLLLCFSTRFCLWETLYYLSQGRWKKATRRWSGRTEVVSGKITLPVYYPTIGQLRDTFAPHFALQSFTGIGVVIPPSYFEAWAIRHQKLFGLLYRIESLLADLPALRIMGDHILLQFEKVSG